VGDGGMDGFKLLMGISLRNSPVNLLEDLGQ